MCSNRSTSALVRTGASGGMRNLLWGVALWLMAQLIVMPMMGGGVFSSQMGGMVAAGGSLVGHLIYGGLLGAIAVAPSR